MHTEVKKRTTGGQVVVDTLRALGIEEIFGVPGGQTLAITDAVLDTDEIRFVTARHEGAAACMADAVGRVTERPGVCLATTGPGATNMLTGIGGAYRDSSPVIAITCNNRLADLDRDDAQAADHVAIFRPLVKWARLVSDARAIEQVLEEAYIRATTGCPGPVLVDFARDVLEDPIGFRHDGRQSLDRVVEMAGERVPGDPHRLARAAEILRDAEAPALWVGNGVKLSRASEEALALARELEMPVITTFNGMGAVPTTDPLVFGALTRMGTELSSRVLAGADVLLAVGNSLNAISTGRWSMELPETIVQIDVEPANIGRYYAGRTHSVRGDARAAMSALRASIGSSPGDERAAAARRARLTELTEARAAWWTGVDGIEVRPGTISPAAVMREVRKVTPEDAIAVIDAGNPGVWSYLWEIPRPNTYIKPVGFGNMGFALPAAIGTKVARPDVPVIAFIGDGSLGMSLAELETVAREDLPICIVVMNDSGYGNIRQEQLVHFGDRTIGVDLGDVDYAAIARACGLQATRVGSGAELNVAVATALSSSQAWLIEAPIDPDVNAWTYPLFQQYEIGE